MISVQVIFSATMSLQMKGTVTNGQDRCKYEAVSRHMKIEIIKRVSRHGGNDG